MHSLAMNNHYYIFDSMPKSIKQEIDINALDKNGMTSLAIALNDKHVQMIERIIREFKEILDFDPLLLEPYPSNMQTPNKQQSLEIIHPLMIAVKK